MGRKVLDQDRTSDRFKSQVTRICKTHKVSKSYVCREIPMHPSLFWKYLNGDVEKPGQSKFDGLDRLEKRLDRNASRRQERANAPRARRVAAAR